VRNATVPEWLESPHKFKTLQLCTKIVRWQAKHQFVFVGNHAESFSLREMSLAVSLEIIATRRFLKVARTLSQDACKSAAVCTLEKSSRQLSEL
jgi:hypothetical protein